MTPVLQFQNAASPSYRCYQLTARAATNTDPYMYVGSSGNALVFWCGANDLAQGHSAATVYANTQAYAARVRATGWTKIITLNMLPCATSACTSAGYNMVQASVNGMLAANHSFVDYLVDVAGNATIGPDAAAFEHHLLFRQLASVAGRQCDYRSAGAGGVGRGIAAKGGGTCPMVEGSDFGKLSH